MNNMLYSNDKPWHTKLWFFCAICLLVFLFGGLFVPGDWYQSLNRAPWNPPNIAFPIAWTLLYSMIAFAGYKTANSNDPALLRLWYAQLALNSAWSWVFFGQHWILAGLINLVVLLVVLAWFLVRSIKQFKTTISLLMLPYFLWLCLATSLNVYIYIYN